MRIALLFLFGLLILLAPRVEAEPGTEIDVTAEIASISKKYRIVISQVTLFPVTTRHGQIDGIVATDENIKAYMPILMSEWSLYPPKLPNRVGLWTIILCPSWLQSVPPTIL